MTRRARRLIAGAALAAGFAAGLTAQAWNPYSRELEHRVTVQLAPGVEEDEAVCFGSTELAYEATSDGAMVTCEVPR